MHILDGIKNFLYFLNDNWTSILVIVVLLGSIVKKTVDFMKKSKEEKIAIAKEQIRQTALKLVTNAECDYLEWNKAGSIKRSQVIDEIFEKYPILSKVTNQEELVNWIDEVINEALDTMRDVFAEQNTDK